MKEIILFCDEPLTDEEFERVKSDSPSNQDFYRLIATVKMQKSDLALGSALVRKIQELKEEIDLVKDDIPANKLNFMRAALSRKLLEDIDKFALGKIYKLEKENAKLKKAHHDMTVEYERLRNKT